MKKKIHGDQEIRCKPDRSKTKCMKFGNYDKVNDNGVIPENTLVEDRDIIISKVLPIKENRNNATKTIKYEDQSRIYRTKENTYIDKNYIERNGDGYNFAKVINSKTTCVMINLAVVMVKKAILHITQKRICLYC